MPSKISRAAAAYTAIAICVIASTAWGTTVEQAKTRLNSAAARLALFELNTGQFASDIAFRAKFPQVNAAIHADGSFSAYPHPGTTVGFSPVRFELERANTNITARAEQPHAYRTNYLVGGNAPRQIRDVPHFQRVQFDEVYPHIALAYYPTDGKLEYDFIVHPLGDVGQISWKVSGAKSLSVNKEGDLVIATASGDYRQKRPLAYQSINAQKRPVDVAYRLGDNGKVGFTVGDYDKSTKLIIDPVIEYASYLGGAGDDNPRAVTIGPDGFIYVSGITRSSDFPTANAFSSRLGGASDAFVTKINPATGALVYSTYLGDARNPDEGMGLAVDNAGNVYVTGLAGTKFPTTSGAYVASSNAKSGFLTKLSPAGNTLLYSTLIPGTQPRSIAIDGAGRAAISGAAGTAFVATAGTHQTASRGDNTSFNAPDLTSSGDAFVLLMNATGTSPVFSTFYGGAGMDVGGGIAIDTSGNLWIGGISESANLAMLGPFQNSPASSRDAFVAVFSPVGQLVASSYLGGSANERSIAGLAADPFGNVVMSGVSESLNFPVAGPLQTPQLIYTTTAKGFVVKFALSPLRKVFATFLGSYANNGDSITGITVDRAGDIHVVGQMNAEVMNGFLAVGGFMTATEFRTRYTNGYGTYAMGISRNGANLRYATLLAPCGEANFCADPAIGSRLAGEVVVAGSTYANWLPIAAANTRPKISGKLPYPQDAFIMTLDTPQPELTLTTDNPFPTSGVNTNLSATAYGPTLTGEVTFRDGSNILGTAPLIEGIASLTAPLAIGIRTLRASLGSIQSPALYLPVSPTTGTCP